MKDKFIPACELIDALGGTNAVSSICDIRPPSVTGWRYGGIPRPWMMYFRCQYPEITGDIELKFGDATAKRKAD